MKTGKLKQLFTIATPMIEQLSQREAEREKRAESRHSSFVAGVHNGFSNVGARLDSVGVRLDGVGVTLREYVADAMRATTRVVDIFDRSERHQREHRDEITVTLTSAEVFELLDQRIAEVDKRIGAIQEKIGTATTRETLRLRGYLSEARGLRSDYVFMRDHLSQGKVFEMNRHTAQILVPQDYEDEAWFDVNSDDEGG